LLDCPLEYKKGESQTNVEITEEEDWEKILRMEEEFIEKMCADIIKWKPDLVMTEKGCSDLAQHYLSKANVTVLRRLRKTDNNRVARATGATIVNQPEHLKEEDVGKGCRLFEVRKLGDEYFSYLEDCEDPKACSIVLRGASKDVLNEIERNLQDAMAVVRNIVYDPRMVPGGGAVEMALGHMLDLHANQLDGVVQRPFRAIATALEVIPRTLIENCGGSTIRLLTELRAKHADEKDKEKNWSWGIDGNKGCLADMHTLGVFEPLLVKQQTIQTAIEAAAMLLRIDDIVSGIGKKKE
jgi:T-complex protein 1 subunit gamma